MTEERRIELTLENAEGVLLPVGTKRCEGMRNPKRVGRCAAPQLHGSPFREADKCPGIERGYKGDEN